MRKITGKVVPSVLDSCTGNHVEQLQFDFNFMNMSRFLYIIDPFIQKKKNEKKCFEKEISDSIILWVIGGIEQEVG